MPEDDTESGEGGSGGGGVIDNGNLNQGCEFINGQWVCNQNEQPNVPTPSPNISMDQECINCSPFFGTRGSYYWDSQEIIKRATAPLNKKDDKK